LSKEVSPDALAGALLGASTDRGVVDDVAEELERVQSILDHNLGLKDAMRNSSMSSESRGAILAEVLGGGVSEVTLSFLRLLVDASGISVLPTVRRSYEVMAEKARTRVTADVTTAVVIDKALEENLQKRLTAATGKDVTIRSQVDESIIGGIVVHVDGRVIDASISRQLEDMRSAMAGTRK